MAIDISSIFDSKNAIDYLVSQYIQLESRPRDNIIDNKNLFSIKKLKDDITILDKLNYKNEYISLFHHSNNLYHLPYFLQKVNNSYQLINLLKKHQQ